jgi:hypothetical protein
MTVFSWGNKEKREATASEILWAQKDELKKDLPPETLYVLEKAEAARQRGDEKWWALHMAWLQTHLVFNPNIKSVGGK